MRAMVLAGTADDKTRATIQSITVNPDTPKKGEDLTVMSTFTLSKPALSRAEFQHCRYSSLVPLNVRLI